jgi:nucleoside-diphosphate-sugar epimerase
MRAHVSKLLEVFEGSSFESVTYLSSTRVYERGCSGDEKASLVSNPSDIADYYKISKIAGEAACLSHPLSTVRVVRLSNVVGLELPPVTFVPSLIQDALRQGKIVLRTALESSKDYVLMKDVVSMLPRIAMEGVERAYNVASGGQTTHEELVKRISSIIPCGYEVSPGAPRQSFPDVSIRRLSQEFSFQPTTVMDELPSLCDAYRCLQNQS